jgi:hypothetical protein
MMQQQAWMAYSCSAHFSDQFSYRTLFISSYRLKVINRLSFIVNLKHKTGFIKYGRTQKSYSYRGEDPGLISQGTGGFAGNQQVQGLRVKKRNRQGPI